MKLLLSVLLLVVSVGCGGTKTHHEVIGLKLLWARVKVEVSGGAPYYNVSEKGGESVWE